MVRDPAESCRATVAKLEAWTQDGLSKRDSVQVEAHLDGCADCRALTAELADVNGALRAVIAPLVLGVGATGYLAACAGKAGAAAAVVVTTTTTPAVPAAPAVSSAAPAESSAITPSSSSAPLPSAAVPAETPAATLTPTTPSGFTGTRGHVATSWSRSATRQLEKVIEVFTG